MDGDTLALILSSQKEMKTAITDLVKAVTAVDKGMVGRENCAAYRSDIDTKYQRLEGRVRETEKICQIYEATKAQNIDGVELQAAKDDAIKISGDRFDVANAVINMHLADMDEKFTAKFAIIDEKLNFIDVTKWGFRAIWGNNVLKTVIVAGVLGLVGIYWGRIGQYGWHIVGAFLGAVILVLLSAWLIRRENRAEAKKLLRL